METSVKGNHGPQKSFFYIDYPDFSFHIIASQETFFKYATAIQGVGMYLISWVHLPFGKFKNDKNEFMFSFPNKKN